ncbi:MAG: hypothetical protein GY739_20795 [Mesoflavibacter sp.]|nr:hypothetical protein [Mesoflavibacter sp.]
MFLINEVKHLLCEEEKNIDLLLTSTLHPYSRELMFYHLPFIPSFYFLMTLYVGSYLALLMVYGLEISLEIKDSLEFLMSFFIPKAKFNSGISFVMKKNICIKSKKWNFFKL